MLDHAARHSVKDPTGVWLALPNRSPSATRSGPLVLFDLAPTSTTDNGRIAVTALDRAPVTPVRDARVGRADERTSPVWDGGRRIGIAVGQ